MVTVAPYDEIRKSIRNLDIKANTKELVSWRYTLCIHRSKNENRTGTEKTQRVPEYIVTNANFTRTIHSH